MYFLFCIFFFVYIYITTCQTNHANPAHAATNGHSNTNAVLTANTPKVFHKDRTARGAEPPVNPLAYGTQVHVRASGTGVNPCKTPAYGKSVLKIEVRTRRRPSRKPSCRRPGGSRGFTPVQKIEVENNH